MIEPTLAEVSAEYDRAFAPLVKRAERLAESKARLEDWVYDRGYPDEPPDEGPIVDDREPKEDRF